MAKIKYKDIFFIENNAKDVKIIKHITVELNSLFGQDQLKTLDDVKEKMYEEVKKCGANAIINFKYGQKSTFWKSIFGLDDVYWYGSGDAVIIKSTSNKL